jgi:hypothetical protein
MEHHPLLSPMQVVAFQGLTLTNAPSYPEQANESPSRANSTEGTNDKLPELADNDPDHEFNATHLSTNTVDSTNALKPPCFRGQTSMFPRSNLLSYYPRTPHGRTEDSMLNTRPLPVAEEVASSWDGAENPESISANGLAQYAIVAPPSSNETHINPPDSVNRSPNEPMVDSDNPESIN